MILFPWEKFKYIFLHPVSSLLSPSPLFLSFNLSKSVGNGVAQSITAKRAGGWMDPLWTRQWGKEAGYPVGPGGPRLGSMHPFLWLACKPAREQPTFDLVMLCALPGSGRKVSHSAFWVMKGNESGPSQEGGSWLFIIWGNSSLAQHFIKWKCYC